MDLNSKPIEIINFLSKEDCQCLIDYHKKSPKRIAKNDFWDGRVVSCGLLTSKKVRRIVEDLQYRIISRTCRHYDEDYLYPDFSNIVQWSANMVLNPHCDNMHIYDPDLEHDTPQRDYSAVLCLNDNYEGGHTTFPEQDIEYSGRTGRVIIFPSGRSHPHGVTEVTSGLRYTFAMWMTKDKDHLFHTNMSDSLTIRVKNTIKGMVYLWKR